ncbi:MAG: hypothetical protein RL399_392 [Actinomycetota bacterium]|jgi:energy-coupling factor transporter transmembrane protein EcfT
MKVLLSLLYGAGAALIAILLHQSVPPLGVIAGLTFSYGAIWLIGRRFNSRWFKSLGAAAWIAVVLRGATFGEGQELMVQGDGVGSALLLLGTLTVLAAVAARN